MSRVAAIVLAAGEGSRFGGAKQNLLLPGILERLARSPVDEVVLIEGAHSLETVSAPDVRIVPCPDWRNGPGASLRCGLGALGPNIEAAVVVLADGPTLAPSAVERVLGAWRERRDTVAASYDGSRGHPLVLGRASWKDIPDEGLRSHPVRLIPCDDLGPPGDVDTRADYEAL